MIVNTGEDEKLLAVGGFGTGLVKYVTNIKQINPTHNSYLL